MSKSSRRLITPAAILSFPNLLEPRAAAEGQEAKYSAALLFDPEGDVPKGSATFAEMEEAALAVAREAFGKDADKLIAKGKIELPWRDDGAEKGYPEGVIFINARSKRKPGCVSIFPDKDGRPTVIGDDEIESELYPGAVVRASIAFFDYDVSGNRGVGVGLNNIQKLRDGDRLDSYVAAEDEFDADEDAVADLGDLTGPQDPEPEEAPKVTRRGRAAVPAPTTTKPATRAPRPVKPSEADDEDVDERDLSELVGGRRAARRAR